MRLRLGGHLDRYLGFPSSFQTLGRASPRLCSDSLSKAVPSAHFLAPRYRREKKSTERVSFSYTKRPTRHLHQLYTYRITFSEI